MSSALRAEVSTINIFVKSLCWMLHSAGEEMSRSCCSYVLLNVFFKEKQLQSPIPPPKLPKKE